MGDRAEEITSSDVFPKVRDDELWSADMAISSAALEQGFANDDEFSTILKNTTALLDEEDEDDLSPIAVPSPPPFVTQNTSPLDFVQAQTPLEALGSPVLIDKIARTLDQTDRSLEEERRLLDQVTEDAPVLEPYREQSSWGREDQEDRDHDRLEQEERSPQTRGDRGQEFRSGGRGRELPVGQAALPNPFLPGPRMGQDLREQRREKAVTDEPGLRRQVQQNTNPKAELDEVERHADELLGEIDDPVIRLHDVRQTTRVLSSAGASPVEQHLHLADHLDHHESSYLLVGGQQEQLQHSHLEVGSSPASGSQRAGERGTHPQRLRHLREIEGKWISESGLEILVREGVCYWLNVEREGGAPSVPFSGKGSLLVDGDEYRIIRCDRVHGVPSGLRWSDDDYWHRAHAELSDLVRQAQQLQKQNQLVVGPGNSSRKQLRVQFGDGPHRSDLIGGNRSSYGAAAGGGGAPAVGSLLGRTSEQAGNEWMGRGGGGRTLLSGGSRSKIMQVSEDTADQVKFFGGPGRIVVVDIVGELLLTLCGSRRGRRGLKLFSFYLVVFLFLDEGRCSLKTSFQS